jgi:hypothetical protein
MPKTKESIAAYNKEYFARPEVIAHAKVRNAQRRQKRAEYKKTDAGIEADKRYRSSCVGRTTAEKSRLKVRYGITLEEVELMKESQGYRCAICWREPKHWHIDHDHKTDRVRGMLCGPCNMALGLLQDDIHTIKKAAEYLDASI